MIRVRKNLKARVITRLLGVAVHDPKKQRRPLRWLQVSEVQVQVRRAGRGTEELRLWTGLLNPKVAPALALVTMYGQRWQHELYYRQMKI